MSSFMRDKDFCECGEVKSKRSQKCRACWQPHNKCTTLPDPEILAIEWESGMTMKQLADKYNSCRKTISKAIKESGIEVVNRGSWKGGRTEQGGYVLVLVDSFDEMASMRNAQGYVPEHRLVVARSIGRPLTSTETVHHINGNGKDNRLENLQLRQGSHGEGQVIVCADCGSHNIVFKEL